MLKKIQVDQLQIGMHLQELCGSWLDHPFWKKSFVLRSPDDLQKLRASGVAECWIDTNKGRDVAANDRHAAPAAVSAVQPVPVEAPVVAAPAPPAHVAIDEEALRAAALCLRSKKAIESLFGEARMGRALSTDELYPLVDDISTSIWRNPGALVSLARLKTHDSYSYMHSVAVCALMVSLARQLGLGEAECRDAGMAGLMHDIGKAVMPLDVLNKPGALTDDEYTLIKSHPVRGRELLAQVATASAMTIDVCAHHHERPDGRGYPDRLSGNALSLHARMGAVCDVYDAITSDRPYKRGWDPADSIARMSEWSRQGQFDPAVFQAFVDSIGIYPIGSLVRLRSGRLAVISEQSPTSALKPCVKVFFSTRSQMPIRPEVVDLSRPNCIDQIVGRESNEKWKFAHLAELVPGYTELKKSATTGKS